jgi:hypothetical protein
MWLARRERASSDPIAADLEREGHVKTACRIYGRLCRRPDTTHQVASRDERGNTDGVLTRPRDPAFEGMSGGRGYERTSGPSLLHCEEQVGDETSLDDITGSASLPGGEDKVFVVVDGEEYDGGC